ncbi:EAL and HDOD domain-containing protein [Acidocella sp.]|uniref:EAL and HDOD domain-containing protein n=1 Tax=Acidocella sp. TaxID=50710 RepID=UPI002F3EF298
MSDSQFFLGRQPIVGRDRELTAYELLFRSSTANAATVLDDVAASATVIQRTFLDLGMPAALGDKQGFINLPASLLMSELIEVLPRERVVLEILETVPLTPDVLARCQELQEAGYTLALDDLVELTPETLAALPLVKLAKLDMVTLSREQVVDLVRDLRPYGLTLLAEKVETLEQYDFCRDLGFDLFQGYFFAKPVILTGRAVPPSALALLKLLGLIVADVENEVLEHALKQAPSLTLNLLKMVNAAAFGMAKKISTLREAIFMLGRVRLSRLVQIMLFAQQSGAAVTSDPLLQTAIVRGRLMEGLADALGWTKLRDRAFMVGMLSLVDAVFQQPMPDLLALINLEESLQNAIMHRSGQLGTLLQLVMASESADGAATLALLPHFPGLNADEFNRLQVEALQWANTM